MGNFYLASESPRGENCHILAVDVLPILGESRSSQAGEVMLGGGVLPKVQRVVEDRQFDWAWGTLEYINIRAKTVTHRAQGGHR